MKAKYVKVSSHTITILSEKKEVTAPQWENIFFYHGEWVIQPRSPGLSYNTLRTVAMGDTDTRS